MAPAIAFPTPVPIDRIVVEKVPCGRAGYRSLPPRTPHPTQSGLILLLEKPVASEDGNLTAIRTYGNYRSAQDVYNAAIRFTDAGNTERLYVRSYYEDRQTFVRGTNGSPLRRIIDLKLNAGGTGYLAGASGEIALVFSGGGGAGAAGRAEVLRGVVVSVFLTAAGDSYTSAPTVSAATGSGLSVTAQLQEAAAVLVDVEAGPAQEELGAICYRVVRTYMVLPGPWVYTRKREASGVFLEAKERTVLASNYPTGSSTIMESEIRGISAAIAREVIKTYVDGNGDAISAPIYAKIEFDAEFSVYRYTYRQKVDAPGTPDTIDSVMQTGLIYTGHSVSALTVTVAGSGYTYLPRVTIQPTTQGTPATGHATMIAASFVDFNVGGTGYLVNDVLTIADGTASAHATLTITKLGLGTVAVNAAGTAYVSGVTITLAGGTFTQAAKVQPATLKLLTLLANATGTGYAVSDTITLAGGTFSVAAVATVATIKLVSVARNAAGTGYVTGNTVTLAGGTSSTKAVLTLTSTQFASGTVFAAGSGHQINDQITLGLGTFTTAAVLTVTALSLTTALISTPGTGYLVGHEITLAGGTFSTAAVVRVTAYDISSASTINAGGTGYAEGDTITMTVGDYTAQIAVTAITGLGVVTDFDVLLGGGFIVNHDSLSQTSTSGAGTGFVLDVVGEISAVIVTTTSGTYTVVPATLTQGSSTGGGTSATFLGLWGVRSFSVTSGGAYTVNASTQSQSSSTGAGTGLDITGCTYGVGTFTITTAGDYTVGSTTFTQHATSGAGTGATFSSGLFGVLTATATTPGIYSVTSTTLTQGATSGAGTGATFNTTSFGLLTVTVSRPGKYSSTLPTTFTQSANTGAGSGATFQTPAWGAGDATLTTAGTAYSELPPISLTAASIRSGGVGYSVGDTITMDGDQDPPTLLVTAISGGSTVGPVSTFSISYGGEMISANIATIFHQASTTGSGNGLELYNPTFETVAVTSGGTGTGAKARLTWKVGALVIDNAGSHYFGAPSVTIQGNATGTATVSVDTGLTTGNVYVINSWCDRIAGTDKADKWTVGMPVPPELTTQVGVAFKKPNEFKINGLIVNDPPRPGIDVTYKSGMGGTHKGTQTRTCQLGQWAASDLPATYEIDTPGVISSLFRIHDRTRHNAFFFTRLPGGTYSENIAASTEVGFDSTLGFVTRSEQHRIAGNLWMKLVERVPP